MTGAQTRALKTRPQPPCPYCDRVAELQPMRDTDSPQRRARKRAGLSLVVADARTKIGLARLSILERLPPERLTPAMRERLAVAYGITEAELVGECP